MQLVKSKKIDRKNHIMLNRNIMKIIMLNRINTYICINKI